VTCNISENAQKLAQQLVTFLAPCLVRLDAFVDTRLMRTFVQTIAVIITFRHRANGLLLSELGAYLESPAHAQQARNASVTCCIAPSGPQS
jgi:hypothetical protein